MNNQKLKKSAFLHGSWSTYELKECQLLPDVTPFDIKLNLNVFNKEYKRACEFISHENLICFELDLEELPNERRGTKKRKKEKPKNKERNTFSFKVALSVEDHLMFSSKYINVNFRGLFAKAFKAKDAVPYDLFGSPPYELLLFHRQAKNSAQDLELMSNKMSLDTISKGEHSTRNRVFNDIGCGQLRVPEIKFASCSISNMPLECDDEHIQGLNTEVELELQCKSLFGLYIGLAKRDIISDTPDWLTASRRAGKTHRNIRYS